MNSIISYFFFSSEKILIEFCAFEKEEEKKMTIITKPFTEKNKNELVGFAEVENGPIAPTSMVCKKNLLFFSIYFVLIWIDIYLPSP